MRAIALLHSMTQGGTASGPTNPAPPPHAFDDSLVAHAERCWKAECENAERISKERHLALTILLAFLGVGLFKVEWLQAVVSAGALGRHWLGTTVLGFESVALVGAIVYFVMALFSLAHRPERTTASAHLSLPKEAYLPAGALSADEQKRLVFARTYRAYQVLQSKNEQSRERLSDAWTRFTIGIVLVAAVIALYILSKGASILLQLEVPK